MSMNPDPRTDSGAAGRAGLEPRVSRPLPNDAVAVIAVHNLTLFPGMVTAVTISSEQAVTAVQDAIKAERPLGFLLQRDTAETEAGPGELYRVGTLAQILRYITTPAGSHHLICQGESRFRVLEFMEGWPFLVARIVRVREDETLSSALEARLVTLRQQVQEVRRNAPGPAPGSDQHHPAARFAGSRRRPGDRADGHQGPRKAGHSGDL